MILTGARDRMKLESNELCSQTPATQWAICIPSDQTESLVPLYCVHGLQVLIDGALIWVRGSKSVSVPGARNRISQTSKLSAIESDGSADLSRLLRGMLGATRFDLLDNDQLVPTGKRVPTERLPQGDWQPLSSWIQPILPATAMVGQIESRIELKITRSTTSDWETTSEPSLLCCEPAAWLAFVKSAAKVRLDPLSFVFDASLNSSPNVLVRGNPLPTVPGTRWVFRSNIAVPIGFHWSPRISEQTVQQILNLADDEMAVFQTDGSWSRISEATFVRASRPAVRATFAERPN